MKKTLLLCILAFSSAIAQDGPFGGKYSFNPDNINCLSDEKSHEIKSRIALAKAELTAQGKLQQTPAGGHPLFQWPVAKNPETDYNNVWAISNYVDHNPSYPNQVQDWNCGSRTYDTPAGYNHAGIDMFTWPFPWYQMANNHSWAVAAAPGVIIGKDNGQSDTSCMMSGANWNAVYVAHSDGSVSWYGHLKNNSLTQKAVGEWVEAGEFLGVIGSSGNSTGPHLHFEVYNNADQLVDTYDGTCNNWTSSTDSWWATQKPYIDPKVNAAFTHHTPPVFPNCPQIETPNLKNEFEVGETVYCAGYFADQNTGAQAFIHLYRPDGTLAYNNWATASELFTASYWYWSFNTTILNQTGIWTVTFSLGGQSASHQFGYGVALSNQEFEKKALTFYPNPAQNSITFSKPVIEVSAFSIDGKAIRLTMDGDNADVSHLPNGVFTLKGRDSDGTPFALKMVK
jgi:murein DD-endopeptidase MepM/ murein hydrolase activator NlpD